ncbi:unnamed protein product [Gulo gulo]|uniref:Transmembrane protein 14C n=1 Tax=Gulo gulo TaxID=48420 RepID=A0A9X9PV45_GULGU|nr:unnamed protein product [Gulo gulo]
MFLSGPSEKRTIQKASGPLEPLHCIGLSCAALVASGGITGCAKASVLSLAAGLLLGGLASLGAHQLSQYPRNIWVFLAISGTLNGIIGMRFHHSGWIRPVGLILGASLLMVTKLGISVLNRPCQ